MNEQSNQVVDTSDTETRRFLKEACDSAIERFFFGLSDHREDAKLAAKRTPGLNGGES
jgi:hypothetical protein